MKRAWLLAGAVVFMAPARNLPAASPNLVISQVYGGGGEPGGAFTSDFVELFNRGTSEVSPAGWSIQAAAAGSASQPFFNDGSNGDAAAGDAVHSLRVAIPAGTSEGQKVLPVTITDAQGRSGSSSLSVTVLPASPAAVASAVIFPHVADGGGYRTTLLLTNGSDVATTATVSFFSSLGTALAVSAGGTSGSSFRIPVAARGSAKLQTGGLPLAVATGWARVTASPSAALGGNAIFQLFDGSNLFAEASVPAAPPTRSTDLFVDEEGGFRHGAGARQSRRHHGGREDHPARALGSDPGELRFLAAGRRAHAPVPVPDLSLAEVRPRRDRGELGERVGDRAPSPLVGAVPHGLGRRRPGALLAAGGRAVEAGVGDQLGGVHDRSRRVRVRVGRAARRAGRRAGPRRLGPDRRRRRPGGGARERDRGPGVAGLRGPAGIGPGLRCDAQYLPGDRPRHGRHRKLRLVRGRRGEQLRERGLHPELSGGRELFGRLREHLEEVADRGRCAGPGRIR